MTSPAKQSKATFEEISQLIWKHLAERDWTEGNPRSLAISIVLEASELLEHYQWSEKAFGDRQELADELADILIYIFQFANATDIDLPKAIEAKLAKAAHKYPAEMFKNKSPADMREAWIEAKTTYKKEGL